jgi:hypothetical protein
MDAVQEFSIQQNSVDAEFGHSAGGTMSVSMKSGTNEIHGTGYYFGRNPAFNAVVNPITRTPNFVRNHIWRHRRRTDQEEQAVHHDLVKAGGNEGCDPDHADGPGAVGDFSQSLTRTGTLRTIYDPSLPC